MLLLIHGLKIDFRQVHRRKTTALYQVSHIAAQVGVDDLRAGDAHDVAHLLLGQVADLKNASLCDLHQKHSFVFDFGLNRGGDGDLKHAFGYRRSVHTKLNIDSRRLLFEQDGWGIGLLQRSLLEVHTLNLENRIELLGHDGSFWSK